MWQGWRYLVVFGLLSAKPILPGNAPIRVFEHRFKPTVTKTSRFRREEYENVDYESDYDYDYSDYEDVNSTLTARGETVAGTTIHFLPPEEVN